MLLFLRQTFGFDFKISENLYVGYKGLSRTCNNGNRNFPSDTKRDNLKKEYFSNLVEHSRTKAITIYIWLDCERYE